MKVNLNKLADLLEPETAYSVGSMTNLAVAHGIILKESAQRFRTVVGRLIYGVPAQITVSPHGLPVDAWFGSAWAIKLRG